LFLCTGSKLHSLAQLITRLDKLAYVLAWTKQKDLNKPFNIDLVELPRLKMAFHARTDSDGVTRLYRYIACDLTCSKCQRRTLTLILPISVDHVNLFVTNTRSELTTRLIRGIPHSVLLSDPNNVCDPLTCDAPSKGIMTTADLLHV
jgi:hypothetical protein